MKRPGVVLVGDDHALGDVLASVASALDARGHHVIRAPAAPPPHLTVFDRDDWPRYLGETDVAVVSSRISLPAELLSWAPRLKGVVFGSIGTGSCDLDMASKLGILVANGATAENVESMAEANVMLASALLLELDLKRQLFSDLASRPPAHEIGSRVLAGKTIGFVGFGRIAQQTLARLAGWRVGRVVAFARNPKPDRWPDVDFVGLADLLRISDVVLIGLPLTEQTKGLIGRAELGAMRRGSVLINTARGGIVDELALAHALHDGPLAAAAIDTFAQEPPPADHPLRQAPNAILTNHIIGHTAELFASLVPAAVDNVEALLADHEPTYIANPEALSRWRARCTRLGTTARDVNFHG